MVVNSFYSEPKYFYQTLAGDHAWPTQKFQTAPASKASFLFVGDNYAVDKPYCGEAAVQGFAVEISHYHAVVKVDHIALFHRHSGSGQPHCFFTLGDLNVSILAGINCAKHFAFL